MNGLIRMQIFYEISMELGVETDLFKTAKKGLSAYLRKLGCMAGMIQRVDLSGEAGHVEHVITIPRSLMNNSGFREESARIREQLSAEGLRSFLNSLPRMHAVAGTNYYLMELNDFGFLLLLKKGEPFDRAALHGISRLNQKLGQACLAGLYTDRLEATVRERTEDLRQANARLKESLASIKTLRGLLPICSGCKKIRDDKGYWNQIEAYLLEHSNAEFTHSLCPACIRKFYPEFSDDTELQGG